MPTPAALSRSIWPKSQAVSPAVGARSAVEHQHASPLRHRGRDLRHVTLGNAQPRGILANVDRLAQQGDGRGGFAVNFAPPHPAPQTNRQPLFERHVFGHRQGAKKLRFLVHRHDARAPCLDRARPVDRSTGQHDLARVRRAARRR